MKIEKINDNQIRCTLNKADLASREIKISELAYGTEKAKNLFRDMMQQASFEFGFEAEDIPLMIEAIPVSADCIVLVITKVEDPEELDTRFSKFAPSSDDYDELDVSDYDDNDLEGADEVLDLFKKVKEEVSDQDDHFVPLPQALNSKQDNTIKTQQTEPLKSSTQNLMKAYSFDQLNTITNLSKVLSNIYYGENSIYKSPKSGRYYLVINKSDHTPEEFNKICNIISEYGNKERTSYACEAFYSEHYELILFGSALQKLALL